MERERNENDNDHVNDPMTSHRSVGIIKNNNKRNDRQAGCASARPSGPAALLQLVGTKLKEKLLAC